jgi:hypothetical protein
MARHDALGRRRSGRRREQRRDLRTEHARVERLRQEGDAMARRRERMRVDRAPCAEKKERGVGRETCARGGGASVVARRRRHAEDHEVGTRAGCDLVPGRRERDGMLAAEHDAQRLPNRRGGIDDEDGCHPAPAP